MDQKTLYAEGSSHMGLARLVGITDLTVRNNMNRHLGTTFTIDGEKFKGLIIEEGVLELRTTRLKRQQTPRETLSALELNGRTLLDLEPGKYYAINVDDLTDFLVTDSEQELWLSLNPNDVESFDELSQKNKSLLIKSRVSRYFNVFRLEGNETELGSFHFCVNPDYLEARSVTRVPTFMVTAAGLCT